MVLLKRKEDVGLGFGAARCLFRDCSSLKVSM